MSWVSVHGTVTLVTRSATSLRMSPPALRLRRFFWRAVSSLMAMSRSMGSSVWTGKCTRITETRLPSWSPSPRIDTGTDATKGSSGRPPCARSHDRKLAQQAVSTTSLTVVPKARLIAFTSSNETSASATDRFGVSAALNGVGGALNASGFLRASLSVDSAGWARPLSRTAAAIFVAAPTARRGLPVRVRSVSAASQGIVGFPSGTQGSPGGGITRPSGLVSKSSPAIAALRPPSMAAWWIFITRAALPPSKPSTSATFHNGLSRSRSSAANVPRSSQSSGMPPGDGSEKRTRCWSRSKSGSSIQWGSPIFNGP